MRNLVFSKFFSNIKIELIKHSPEVLTGIGIAGMIVTTVLAVQATPKAIELLGAKKAETEVDNLAPVEVVKTVWSLYIPAVVTACLSIICLVGANSTSLKRNAVLAAACTLSETAMKEYREKVIEVVGDKKEQSVVDAIAKEKITKDPVTSHEVFLTEKGNTLCYDALSGRYFKSDIDKIKKTVNELNRIMLTEGYISLNDFYYELGLASNKLGNDIGWYIDDGFIDLALSSQLAEGTPCLVIGHGNPPKYDYKYR